MEKSPAIYDAIGKNYNATRMADPHIAARLQALLEPEADGNYLDIGCGTGNYTLALAANGLHFCGIDPSEEMLQKARQKSGDVQWIRGSAEQIPLDDPKFSGIIGTLTLHHWKDHKQAFRELFRVLQPGGKAVFFTSDPEQMKGYWLNQYFPAMLRDSIAQMPSAEKIITAATAAGFQFSARENYFVQDDLRDLFLYCGKNRPEMYFDENVRQGISSFSALSNAEEVKNGLAQLRADIGNGNFGKVKRNFENDRGDYLFLVFTKS